MFGKAKIVFMGTPIFAKNILEGLYASDKCEIVAVYTMPDAVRGRGKKLVPTAVKQFATQQGLRVETPQNFKDSKSVDLLASFKPDFLVVAAYGMILPQAVLDIPKYEALNVHGSILPKWRGAAPVQRSILAGEKSTGFTIMRMEAGLDSGPMYDKFEFSSEGMNASQVLEKMSIHAPEYLLHTISSIIDGKNNPQIQDEKYVTFADKIEKRELWLSNEDTDSSAYLKIKASTDENPCKCKIAGKTLRIIDANLVDEKLDILQVKPDGKNVMDWKAFVAGVQDKSKENLKWTAIE